MYFLVFFFKKKSESKTYQALVLLLWFEVFKAMNYCVERPRGYFFELWRNFTRLKSDPVGKLSDNFFPAVVYLGKHRQTNWRLVSQGK